MSDVAQLREIATELRRLLLSSPTSKDALAAWYEDSRRFSDRLDADFPGVDLPEEVWHFLHDADLRVKDPQHKQMQDQMIKEIIADLENGVVPAPRGVAISVHPRWIGVAGLVLVALFLYWVAR
jgi:hypothetical protein